MHLPVTAQHRQGGGGQRHETVPVALGIADVHTLARRVDIADLQPQPFAEPQAHAVERQSDTRNTRPPGARRGNKPQSFWAACR